jgi:hypothetical protein
MPRAFALLVVVAFASAGCGGARHTYRLARPGPATVETARLVATEGTGDRRLSLWVARDNARDVCLAWSLGHAPRNAFRCQRRGLERPVLWVEGGGGGQNIPWGGDVGLVAPGVTRVTIDDAKATLQQVRGLPGWRSFAGSSGGRPGSQLVAYAGARKLLEDTGLWVDPEHPTYGYVPEQERGDDARATDLALAQDGVRKVLDAHAPAWIDTPIRLEKCIGGTFGESIPLRLWKPATYRATLPVMKVAPGGKHVAYTSGEHRVLALRSNELLVSVDTHNWHVIGVETAFERGIEVPIGTTRRAQPGGGYDDPAQCPTGD